MPDTNQDALVGRGFAYPLRLSVQGKLQLSASEQNLRESILLILRTNLGERKYRPNFGCRLGELLFAPMNTTTLRQARLFVRQALTHWEPRIAVDEVRIVNPNPQTGRMDILIAYHPINTHDRRSLVYPFYLVPESEQV
ncbi:GPW/gp25 family protein [Synechococcus sp. PCC 7336]|uniref:GPW/gp25 family protein n=1 Tax=Synechococcus sp. PCC 7336 TaxID=195250 RepID=UPI00034BF3A4|nr:GPW/gp25 family protein [Synechococcus sp. PCC 7336]